MTPSLIFPPPAENRAALPAALLAAFVLGLVLCSFIYAVIAQRQGFGAAFYFAVLPPLLIGNGYLLFRLLGRPQEPASRGVWLIAETLSWFVIAAFIAFVSYFVMDTLTEGIAALFVFNLLASLFSLPVVLLRKTALQQRLMKLPHRVTMLALALVVSLSATVVGVDLLTPYSACSRP